MSAPEIFTLSGADRANPLWHKLKGYLNRRLEAARARNDNPLPPDETAVVRGEIRALKGLLKLDEELPPVDGEEGGAL